MSARGRGPSFTLGIEEEYHLVDRASRDLVSEPPADLIYEAQLRAPGQVSPEFLRSQIEVRTGVCSSLAQARAELTELRQTIVAVAGAHGLAPMAAATHPFADWAGQKPTDATRYLDLAGELQLAGRRLTICGLHVHVGIDDDELRIDLMSQATYFLPHLLALSASSPFWRGEDTGFSSFRLSVFNGLPRTGLPENFDSWSEYQRQISRLTAAKIIDDAGKIWWDLRPAARFPTLELRITDVCPRLEDALAIAALFRCILRMLWRLRLANQRWRLYPHLLIGENRWRAQRYGVGAALIDFGKLEAVPFAALTEELVGLVAEDAAFFGCAAEVAHCLRIAREGSSADRQRATHRAALAAGATPLAALQRVVDGLTAETAG